MQNLHKKNVPLVSAIITTKNRINLLKKAVESILSQTYPNIELIVVSDDSSDGTNEWAKSQDFKFINISSEESKGGNHARNLGIKATNGKYIAFLDDDDYWLPKKIEKQVEKIEKTKNNIIHCSRINEIIETNDVKYIPHILPSFFGGNLKKRILYQITVLTSGLMIRKDILNMTGLFDENCNFWQEYELTIRLAQVGDFDLIQEPLFVYRIDTTDKNRLTNKYKGWKDSVKYIYHKHQKLYDNLNYIEKFRVKSLFWRDSSLRRINIGDKNLTSTFQNLLSRVINFIFRKIDKKYEI